MKNILSKILIFLSIALLFSCSKELEYGSDFDFKINNIDNNSVVINTNKTFTLELTKFFNQSNDKTFKVSYDCENVDIIDNNITLLKNVDYNFTFSELSTLELKMIVAKKGDYTLTINLTDINGLKKSQQIIVKAVEDLNFEFVANNAQPVYEDVLSTTFNFALNLTNIGTSPDTYKIKAFSSLTGTILVNNNLVVAKELYDVSLGNITVAFTPDMIGVQTLTLVVVNSQNLEKEVSLNLNVTQKVFTVTTVSDFSTKQNLNKTFTFVTANTISNWTYQVKFTSNTQAKIFTNDGNSIPLNTFVDLPINTNSFNFIYLSDAIGSDILQISVKDKNNQIITAKTTVTVTSKPTITAVTANVEYKRNGYASIYAKYNIVGAQAYGQGVTITDYEFAILNYSTNKYDIYTTASNTGLYPFSGRHRFYSRIDPNTGAETPQQQITNEDRNINYYWNQPYSVRVKDSDGVWSNTVTGIMTY